MDLNSSNVIHIVVDMLYDFIDGTLACKNAFSAKEKTIDFINKNPNQRVLYVCDCHPENHCSFIQNGGIWPSHCVEGTRGQQIHEDFFTRIKNESSRPKVENIFSKGMNSTVEQYSSFNSSNINGESLSERIMKTHFAGSGNIVLMSGIATEFCILGSSTDFLNAGIIVYIATDGLAYVDFNGHINSLKTLKEKGAVLI